MYPGVIHVSPNKDFSLEIEFDNGEAGVLDMKPYLEFGVFRQIKNTEEFQKVRISFDAIEWQCGIDLDPEFIYEKCRKKAKA